MSLHESAKSTHYDQAAKYYDSLNEASSASTNKCIEGILQKHGVKTVLDLTCGTGSQAFWLAKKGFEVVGSDINAKMLKVARDKNKEQGCEIKFIKGDMRTTQAGEFDAVLTIFNAVGHLTKKDFEKAMKNINKNLNPGGLYIFDIFNLGYLTDKDNITKLTIDDQTQKGNAVYRKIQYSTISADGVLASYDIYHEQKGNSKPKRSEAFQTLQVYNKAQLKEMLESTGFKVLKSTDINGNRFHATKSERILTVAKKIS
jgi:ubiquinone/menaquinone biosynthesis C-methylase UbiE